MNQAPVVCVGKLLPQGGRSIPMQPMQVAVLSVGAALAVLALGAALQELPTFWDPCRSWGQKSGSTLELRPGEGCQSKSGTSETKAQAAARIIAVFGTAALAGSLAVLGAVRRKAWPAAVAAGLMAVETPLLFLGLSIAFVLTLAAGLLFLAGALAWRVRARPSAVTDSESL